MSSPGAGYTTTDAVLAEAARDVTTTKNDLEIIIRDLRSRLGELNSAWRGRGGSAFQGAIEAWQRTADRVVGAMDNFHANLTGTEATYSATEDTVASGLNRYQDSRL
ncbi:WXG100 family type VII secretion target [Nocardioides jensenii]|uniref:WXG100 family type VII secretion target n=1 Tax=Nocardioides jensenii TaxID=1843 RepID=UPI0008344EDA|nr:WXG100 family type VII secretion target [Nocardioides jensenii]